MAGSLSPLWFAGFVVTPGGSTPGNGARRTVLVNDCADAVAASASAATTTAAPSRSILLMETPSSEIAKSILKPKPGGPNPTASWQHVASEPSLALQRSCNADCD